MFNLPLRKDVYHIHRPAMHDMRAGIGHLVHNKSFWAVLAIVILVAVLLTFVILASIYGEGSPERIPSPFPYQYGY